MLSSLTRRLGTADAVALGMVAMLGSGAFAVFAPAAAVAGVWLPLAVALAAVAAFCSAWAAADLAVAHPESGGGEVAVRDRLPQGVRRLAGVAMLVGKVAAAAAAAQVFGAYVLPAHATVCAVVVLVVGVVLVLAGMYVTPGTAWLLAGGTLAVLAVVVVVGLLGPGAEASTTGVSAVAVAVAPPALVPVTPTVAGVLTAAGLAFFAFAGFARVATIGEELRDPDRSLGRAIGLVFGVLTVAYLAVAGALVVGLGADRLAAEQAPLVALVDTGQAPALGVLVRIGAAVAAGSMVLVVLGSAGRTMRAMAARHELPRAFGRLGGRGTAWAAALLSGVLAVTVVFVAGPTTVIAVAACATLAHHALLGVAALRLPRARRRHPAWVAALGVLLCTVLAILLPIGPLLLTVGALAVGWLACTAVVAVSVRRAGSGK